MRQSQLRNQDSRSRHQSHSHEVAPRESGFYEFQPIVKSLLLFFFSSSVSFRDVGHNLSLKNMRKPLKTDHRVEVLLTCSEVPGESLKTSRARFYAQSLG